MRLPVIYHRAFARIAGLRVEYRGTALQGAGVVHVSNHLSYLDVTALGRRVQTRFVAKEDVRGWPLFGLLAKVQQTVFVSRRRHHAGAVGDALSRALDGAHGLLLFPEGTTSDGAQLLPFKSAAFAALAARPGLRLQPVRIELLTADGRTIPPGERAYYAYFGEATLLPHFWRFLRGRGACLRVHFLDALVVPDGADRKQLARAAWHAVAGQPVSMADAAASA
jgi:1-acyl-sn-glycerol-3-phosphate acyltransferase